MSRDAFVALVTTDLPPAPAYFGRDAEQNRVGAPALHTVRRPAALTPLALERFARDGVIIDTRSIDAFEQGHVAGAIFLGLGGPFAPWAGTLLPHDRAIALVVDDEQALDEAVVRLARVGVSAEQLAGYLTGGMAAWQGEKRPIATLRTITTEALQARAADFTIVDVRRRVELESGKIFGAVSAPLEELATLASSLPSSRPIAVICGSGYRSTIAASILSAQDGLDVVNVVGGMRDWKAALQIANVPAGPSSSKGSHHV